MKITLVNGWSDDNKGDAAIVEGLVRSVQAQANTPPQFTIVSMFRRPSGGNDHYRHTRRLADTIDVHPALIPVSLPGGADSNLALIADFLLAVGMLLTGTRGRWFLPASRRATWSALVEADLVISKGGHIYFANGSARSFLALFRNLFPVLLAQRLGRPTVVYGQSIGPVCGRLQRWLLRAVLNRLSGLYVREPVSLRRIDSLGVVGSASICWDSAFTVQPEALPSQETLPLDEPFVAVTVRQWFFPYRDSTRQDPYSQYLAGVADCMARIRRELGLRLIVVPQVIGPTALEDDLKAAAQLRKYLPYELRQDTIFLEDDFTAGQLATLYGKARFVLATRFHSAILAISAGTPAVVISYHGPKAEGIMEMLGLGRFVIGMEEATGEALWSRCVEVYERRDQLGAVAADRKREIEHSIAASVREILERAVPAA